MSDKDEIKEEEIEDNYEETNDSYEESGSTGLDKNVRNILLVAVAIILVVGGVWYYVWNKERTKVEATKALTRIVPLYQANQFERALNGDKSILIDGKPLMGMKEISEKYSGTEIAKQAALYTGTCLLYTNKLKEAEPYFKTASEAESKLVTAAAFAGYGQCKEMQGDFAGASNFYDKAAAESENDLFKIKNMLFAGLCYEKAGNKDKAVEMFKNVVGHGRVSDHARVAKSRLALLGIIID